MERQDNIAEELHHLVHVISDFVEQKRIEFAVCKSRDNLATKQDLIDKTNSIMSAISEFGARQEAYNSRIDTAITGIQEDINTLNELINTLQTTPGPITPEDQATLDALEARGQVVTDKLEALNALTPPPVPKG